jgi:hypothetical protein
MTPSRDEALAAIRARAARREVIATAILAGLDPSEVEDFNRWGLAQIACDRADALIAELDARRQAEEAQA